MRIKSPKDFWSGLIFIVAGGFISGYAATHYQMGSALRMGPGYFPVWLGALQLVLGLIVFSRSFVLKGEGISKFHWRPIILTLGACVVYGFIMKPAGLIIATIILTFLSALGGPDYRHKDAIYVSLAMVFFSVTVFVWGLKLPFPLWPEAFQ